MGKKIAKGVFVLDSESPRMPISNMRVQDVVENAKEWWARKGSDLNRYYRNRKTDGIKDDEELQHRSGILFGWPWDRLTRGEQLRVTKLWHEKFVEFLLTGTVEFIVGEGSTEDDMLAVTVDEFKKREEKDRDGGADGNCVGT